MRKPTGPRDTGFKVGTHKRYQCWTKTCLEHETRGSGAVVWSACHEQAASKPTFSSFGRGKHSPVMADCTEAQLWPCPSCCQLGLSKVGVHREPRPSLRPQVLNPPFVCLKSCRELNRGACGGRRLSFRGTLFGLVSVSLPGM